ncbi:S1 family peptidase [Rhizobium ruizarguesonis]|uniref:S1 family peptidase n=1 Tax=Rhizobium ruizarguesonis TaxID=2081791 RepID=UPI0013EEC50D|nr:serine protease [Rhizobium ruizarguesonis]
MEEATSEDLSSRQATFDRRYKLLELKERRADRELKRQEISANSGRGSAITPAQASVAAAIIALASGVVGGLIQGATSRDVEGEKSKGSIAIEKLKAEANIALEKQKFETTLILKATEASRREDQIRNLKFFLNAGFISDPDGKIAKMDDASFPSLPPPTTQTPADIFKQTKPSVGRVTFEYTEAAGLHMSRTGTCFIVSKDGYALTAAHVVSSPNTFGTKLVVSLGSGYSPSRAATIVKIDSSLDIALIKLPQDVDYTPLQISKTDQRAGDSLILMGFSSQELMMSVGNVASIDTENGLIAIDAQTTFGQSGSPILNTVGEVIGTIRGARENGIGLVLPIKLAQSLLAGVAGN